MGGSWSAIRPLSLWARFLRLASHIAEHFGPCHSALGHPVNVDLIAERAFTGALHHDKTTIDKFA
jgi:hypothetical protein